MALQPTCGRVLALAILCSLLVAAPAAAQGGPPDGDAAADPDNSGGEGTESDAERMERHDESMQEMSDQEAKSHFRVGRTLYDEGRFRKAAEEFRKAHELSGRSALLFNMYLAYRDAGALEQAIDALSRYLDEADEIRDRASLRSRLEAMRETQRRREKEQARRRREAEHARKAEQQKRASETQTKPEPGLFEQASPAVWVTGGVGLAALAAGTVTGVFALQGEQELADDCPGGACAFNYPLEEKRSRTRRLGRATDALLFGGAALVGTGIVLLFLDLGGSDETTGDTAEAAAMCTPQRCGGSLKVEF